MSVVPAAVPDIHGRFGPYGGRYVPETLDVAGVIIYGRTESGTATAKVLETA